MYQLGLISSSAKEEENRKGEKGEGGKRLGRMKRGLWERRAREDKREGRKKNIFFRLRSLRFLVSLSLSSLSMPSPPLSPVATTCPPRGADGEDGDASAGPSSLLRELSLLSPRAGSAPQLEQLVSSPRRCHLTPAAFMVSWQGVLTLAYR